MHASVADLETRIDHVASAPSDLGRVELIVCRPDLGEREVLHTAELRPGVGLVGDNYLARGSRHRADGTADPLAELNIMS
ncbi:hypothetical protein VSR69_46110, partial [Paraburkholderia phytofirmans]